MAVSFAPSSTSSAASIGLRNTRRTSRGYLTTRSILIASMVALILLIIVWQVSRRVTSVDDHILMSQSADSLVPPARLHRSSGTSAPTSRHDEAADVGEREDRGVVSSSPGATTSKTRDAVRILEHFDHSALDSLLTCASTHGAAAAAEQNVTADESVNKNEQRYDQCFHRSGTMFLYYGNQWGRHFNQMTSLVAAVVLARMLQRTLVMPPFLFEKHRVDLYDLYDARRLMDVDEGPFCILTEDEFYTLETSRIRRLNNKQSTTFSSLLEVEATCVTMRGIKPHPQIPQQYTFKCSNTLFVKYKKDLQLFFDVVGTCRDRFVTLPLVIYYAQALPEDVVFCPWKLIRPHPVILRALTLLRRPSSSSTEDDDATTPSVGIHMRSLEGSCQSRQLQYNSGGAAAQRAAGLVEQCAMSPEYVMRVVQEGLRNNGVLLRVSKPSNPLKDDAVGGAAASGRHLNVKDLLCVIADDGQQPERVRKLMAALPMENTIRMQEIMTSRPDVKRYFEDIRSNTKKTPLRTSRGVLQPPYHLQGHFHVVPAALPLLFDFWALATSTVFVGNQVSTLSMNVCRYRLANNMRCDNFV